MEDILEKVNIFILVLSLIGLCRIFFVYFFTLVYDNKLIKLEYKYEKEHVQFKPTITIVIPAFNEEKSIVRTLESVCSNTYENKNVVVVDDGSLDNTFILTRKFIQDNPDARVKVVRQKNGGKSVAINNALFNHVGTDLIMVLDADSILKKDAIENMCKWFFNDNIIAMAMNVKMLNLPSFLGVAQRFEFINAYRGKCAEHVLKTIYIIGGIGSTFRVKELRNVGGYDINTQTEDIDLTLKLISKFGNSQRIVGYANDAIAYTEPVSSFKSLIKQRYRWKYGRFVAFSKYKNLFFNRDKKYSKLLTFLQLPFSLIQEVLMLVEPYVFVYLILIAVYFKDWYMLWIMATFVTVIVLLSLTNSKENLKSKLYLVLSAPFNMFLSYILTVVEYTSLLKSFFHLRTIFNYKKNNANWEHVERL